MTPGINVLYNKSLGILVFTFFSRHHFTPSEHHGPETDFKLLIVQLIGIA